jgi:DNA-binding transcriptional LysR family regulator
VEYVRPERVYEAVRSDCADIGLVSYPQHAKDLATLPWREEEMVVASAPSHPLAQRDRVSPTDLDGLPFIGFDPELPIRRDVDRFLRDHDVEVEVTMHFDSIPMVNEASAVSILPVRMMHAEVQQGRLAAIPLEAPGLVRPLGIVHLKRKRFSRAAQSFLSLLQENGRD